MGFFRLVLPYTLCYKYSVAHCTYEYSTAGQAPTVVYDGGGWMVGGGGGGVKAAAARAPSARWHASSEGRLVVA